MDRTQQINLISTFRFILFEFEGRKESRYRKILFLCFYDNNFRKKIAKDEVILLPKQFIVLPRYNQINGP